MKAKSGKGPGGNMTPKPKMSKATKDGKLPRKMKMGKARMEKPGVY